MLQIKPTEKNNQSCIFDRLYKFLMKSIMGDNVICQLAIGLD